MLVEADAGYRGDEFGTRATTALARLGAGFRSKSAIATAGCAWFETIDISAGAPERAEFRIYQKLSLRQVFKRLELTHIYRVEERWMQRADHSAWEFQMRLRYMLQLRHEFQGKNILGATPYVTANNEIFLAPDDRVFSQYRLYGGAGLVWNKKWRLELGYLHLWLPKTPKGTHDDGVIRTSVTYSW